MAPAITSEAKLPGAVQRAAVSVRCSPGGSCLPQFANEGRKQPEPTGREWTRRALQYRVLVPHQLFCAVTADPAPPASGRRVFDAVVSAVVRQPAKTMRAASRTHITHRRCRAARHRPIGRISRDCHFAEARGLPGPPLNQMPPPLPPDVLPCDDRTLIDRRPPVSRPRPVARGLCVKLRCERRDCTAAAEGVNSSTCPLPGPFAVALLPRTWLLLIVILPGYATMMPPPGPVHSGRKNAFAGYSE